MSDAIKTIGTLFGSALMFIVAGVTALVGLVLTHVVTNATLGLPMDQPFYLEQKAWELTIGALL